MGPYRAVIADDEPLLCQQMQASLKRLWPDLEIVAAAENGEQALQFALELEPDVLFLDIRMPGLTGLEVARRLAGGGPSPLVVFVTAYDQYAIDAFEREAVDYLLKPVDEQRLAKTLRRVGDRLANASGAGSVGANLSLEALANLMDKLRGGQQTQKLTWIKTMRQDNIYLISPDDVYYFQAEDKYTNVVTKEHEYIIRTPIKELKDQLNEDTFLEIRRGTLVNSRFIEKINRDFVGRLFVHMKDKDTKLQISRSLSGNFKQM